MEISPQLRTFVANRDSWSREVAVTVADGLADTCSGGVDWDRDSGEDWIRILRGPEVVALVSAIGPLAFVVGSSADRELARRMGVVVVPDLQAAVLASDVTALRDAFGERAVNSPALNPQCFSAEDLWFVSV